jgi:hypothetical protein
MAKDREEGNLIFSSLPPIDPSLYWEMLSADERRKARRQFTLGTKNVMEQVRVVQ